MILLDTNVVSEPLRQVPEARVTEGIDSQVLETLFLSAITLAELRAGLALLPAGKRRRACKKVWSRESCPFFAAVCRRSIWAAPKPMRT